MQHRFHRTIRATVCLLPLLGISACGGGDEGGSASRSGVDGKKSVADTTTEDVRKLCRWMQQEVGDLNISDEKDCTADVIDDGADAAECEELVQACLDEPASEPAGDAEGQCDSIEKPDFPAGCGEITVRDYENCVSGLKSAIESYINGLSCAENAGDKITIPMVAACEKLRDDCPEILPPPAR